MQFEVGTGFGTELAHRLEVFSPVEEILRKLRMTRNIFSRVGSDCKQMKLYDLLSLQIPPAPLVMSETSDRGSDRNA